MSLVSNKIQFRNFRVGFPFLIIIFSQRTTCVENRHNRLTIANTNLNVFTRKQIVLQQKHCKSQQNFAQLLMWPQFRILFGRNFKNILISRQKQDARNGCAVARVPNYLKVM